MKQGRSVSHGGKDKVSKVEMVWKCEEGECGYSNEEVWAVDSGWCQKRKIQAKEILGVSN